MQKTKKINIAIDGFSSTGKSTVAKRLAQALQYIYVDTGAMYRAVTFYAMQKHFIGDDFFHTEELIKSLPKISLAFKYNPTVHFSEMYLNNHNIENEIRSMEVSAFVSQIAKLPEVRSFLVKKQREMGHKKGVVMDGRDIGSVVFPDAALKIYLKADAKIRAERRLLEMQSKGLSGDFESIYKNIVERDHIDSTRSTSPLIKVPDAIEIDVTHIDQQQQFDMIYNLALESIKKSR